MKKRIWLYGKATAIMTIVLVILFFVVSVGLMFCGFISRSLLYVGITFFVIAFMLLISVIFLKFVVILEADFINITTLFGHKKVTKKWEDLSAIEVKKLRSRYHPDKYIILKFSKTVSNTQLLYELLQEENVILFAFSEKNYELILNYVKKHKGNAQETHADEGK